MKVNKDKGFFIIEVLISLLVFTIGVMSVLNFQKNAISNSTNSQNRLVAINYSESLINKIFLDKNNIDSYINKTSPEYSEWLNELKENLPNVQYKEPEIYLETINGKTVLNITIYWKDPANNNFSQHTVKTGVL